MAEVLLVGLPATLTKSSHSMTATITQDAGSLQIGQELALASHTVFEGQRMPRSPIAATVLMLVAFLVSLATAKDGPKAYEVGKLLDLTVEDVSRGTAIIGGMAASIPGRLYVFKIQLGELVYVAEYRAGKLSYKPEWIVHDPIELRLEKDKMFLKRPDGKELEVMVIKRVRPD